MSFGRVKFEGKVISEQQVDNIGKDLNDEIVEELVRPVVECIQESEKTINRLDKLNADKTREYVQALSREEMEIAASVIPADILLEALSVKFKRLGIMEERIKNILNDDKLFDLHLKEDK